MSRAITRFFDSQDEAIKVAKKRAKSTYHTQYIYREAEGLCIRQVFYKLEGERPILKVVFDGTVCTPEQETIYG